MFDVEAIRKSVGRKNLIKSSSFSLEPGEIATLLMRREPAFYLMQGLLTGRVKPDRGRILIAGRDLALEKKEASQQIGWITPDIAAYDDEKLGDWLNLHAAIEMPNKPLRQSKLKNLIEKLRLKPLLSLLIGHLPGEVRQRACLALALFRDPALLIFEDPFQNLDYQESRAFYAILQDLADQGEMILVTAHNAHQLKTLCQRYILFTNGRLQTGLGHAGEKTVETAKEMAASSIDPLPSPFQKSDHLEGVI